MCQQGLGCVLQRRPLKTTVLAAHQLAESAFEAEMASHKGAKTHLQHVGHRDDAALTVAVDFVRPDSRLLLKGRAFVNELWNAQCVPRIWCYI